MSSPSANFSVRLPEATKEKIDALAKVLGRPRNYVIAEAVERYIEEESWQLAEIQAGIAEDDAGQGLPHDEVMRDAYSLILQAEATLTNQSITHSPHVDVTSREPQ